MLKTKASLVKAKISINTKERREMRLIMHAKSTEFPPDLFFLSSRYRLDWVSLEANPGEENFILANVLLLCLLKQL